MCIRYCLPRSLHTASTMASARATRGRWGASLALASLCLAAVLAVAQAFKTIDEVPYAEKDEATGKTVVVTMTGKKWELVLSKEHSRVYFLELDVPEGKEQRAIWEDPRTEPLTGAHLTCRRRAFELSAPAGACRTTDQHHALCLCARSAAAAAQTRSWPLCPPRRVTRMRRRPRAGT